MARGARQFLLVSSVGADPDSGMFYSRVKGEVETAIAAVGFRLVTIARPSLLLGPRTERRLAGGLVAAARQELPGVRAGESGDPGDGALTSGRAAVDPVPRAGGPGGRGVAPAPNAPLERCGT